MIYREIIIYKFKILTFVINKKLIYIEIINILKKGLYIYIYNNINIYRYDNYYS